MRKNKGFTLVEILIQQLQDHSDKSAVAD
ncbi:MAG: prepilin-type N-terminal cleavage/methylation domain-containing protein [Planctomycetota bacterium]